MAAYMVVHSLIIDEEKFAEYREAVLPLIRRFGGRPIRGGKAELLEGRQDERQLSLFEFPTIEAIHAFWNAPEYGPVKELRRGAADLEVWAVPGI
jgi:uncharacterized protein (DUF1330 family)